MVSEIVHRLIDGERENFRNGFQRVLNRVPRRGSTTEPSFFPYFFLGSVLTLPYTELNDEIGIKSSCVKIAKEKTVKTIKLAFRIEKDQKTKLVFKTITTVKKIGNKQHLDIGEFKEALGSFDLTEDELNNREVEGEIVHIKDGEVSLEKLEVLGKGELNSETLIGPLPEYDEQKAKFKKVKANVIGQNSLGDALEQFSKGDPDTGEELSPSSKGAEDFFENLSKVYRSQMKLGLEVEAEELKKLGLSDYEAPAHGFVYGTLAMNFRYEHALRIRAEQAAGRGFVDLVVGSHGREFRVELKGLKGTAQDAKRQSEREGYNKAPMIFSFEEEKEEKSVTMVFANLCSDPSSGGLLVEESKVPPEPERFIELFREHSGESLKEKLKEKLNYLYYSISDSNGGGKNTNYLSRLILGELLAGNTLEKHVFIYEGNHIEAGIAEHDTRSGQVPEDVSTEISKMVSTFLFKKQGGKYVVLNVIEGENFEIDKNIPLDGIELSKCTQVNIKVNPKANGGFEVESDINKSYYQGIEIGGVARFEHEYGGEFETIEYVGLQDITDITQVRGFQEALYPLRKLITLENHFQAILQGLLSAQEGVEVLTEPNYSSRGKPDLLISHRGKDGEICVAAVELKLASTEKEIKKKREEGEEQLKKRADGLETITKEGKVEAAVLVVCPSVEDKDKFITHFRTEDLNVEHSSRGSSDGEPLSKERHCSGERGKRSIGTCIDSRDEESAEEKKGKEELIKELFDTDEIRERIKNVEFYDQLYKISKQISRGETINENAKEAFIERVKDINLNSIDLEIRDIVVKIKGDLSKGRINKGLRSILQESGVAEKIGKVAEGAGLGRGAFLTKEGRSQELVNKITSNPKAMGHLNRIGRISGWFMQGTMYRSLIDDALSGDLKGVGINLGFIAGSPLLNKMAEAASSRGLKLASEGKVFLSNTLKAGSPFLARATSGFIVYDLVNQVKELKADDKDALVGVVGDSIYLGVDVAEIGVELAEFAGILEGVSSVAGPIGAAIGAIVFVGTDIYLAVRTVEQEDKIIHLTGWEKFKEGWRALLHIPPEQYMEELIGEKEVNNQLVKSGIELLKRNTDIQRYVFPTGKSVVGSCRTIEQQKELCSKGSPINGVCPMGTGIYKTYEHEKCNTKIQPDLESSVIFSEKTDIFPSEASPDNPEEGELFCLPLKTSPRCNSISVFNMYWGDCQPGNVYYCDSAIGVSYTKDRTGNYTLIALGKGKDVAVGFKGSPNVFLVEDGEKRFFGGDGDDIFVLSGSEITGILDGDSGNNTIDFGKFRMEEGSLSINPGSSTDDLKLINMNNILGRENRKDSIYCDHNTKYIDGRGGKGKNTLDNVILDNCRTSDHGVLTIAVKPYTHVENRLSLGHFTYVVHQGRGESSIDLGSASRGKYSFLFNYTLQNIEAVSSSGGSVVFTFSLSSNLNNVSIYYTKGLNNVFYKLSGGTEIRIGNKGGLYALQNTDKQVDKIIKDYPAIANRLNMTIAVQSSNESIIIGHGKHEVLHNNPEFNSHLVGNGGENIYIIAPTQKEINIYDVDEEDSIDTLNLRDAMKEAQNVSLKVSQSGNDLLIKLEGGESLLKFPIRIKNGTLWYKKFHVVGDSMPMQINKHSDDAWNLGLGPLTFDDNIKIAVITVKDVDEGNKLIVHKQAGQYAFSRLRDDLIIITDPSLEESNACTILLSNFYKEQKMETLSIEFKDITISLQEKMMEINEAVAFCPRVLQMNKEFSVDGSNLLSRYDCLKFNSDKILFLRLGNSLLLLSDKGKLLMSDYYSDVHEKWNLPVELNDDITTSEEFRKRAENASPFRYYQPGEEGLEIYHNQPTNKHQVGLMDLKNRSILDCSVKIIDRDLILSFEGKAIGRVKNWDAYQPAREMMFAFNNAAVFNTKCISSDCDPEDIVEEFEKKKVKLVSEYSSSLLKATENGDLDQIRGLLGRGADVNAKDGGGRTPLHYAAVNNNLEAAKLLTERGTNVSARANNEKTPLDLARPGSKVENFLKNKQRKRLIQRRRRHHDREQREQKYLQEGGRPIHLKSKGASRSIENDNPAIESNRATSAASKPSSWINVFANTIVDAVKGVSRFISSPFKPAIDMKHSQPSKAMTTQSIDTNGTLLLLDVFIRKITCQKYFSTADQPISPLEARGYTLNITNRFEEVVRQAALKSSISMHRLSIDFMEIQKEITGKIMGGKFDEISGILNSHVEKACPGREAGCPGKLSPNKFNNFMNAFNKRLDLVLNQSIQQMLHNENNVLKAGNIKEQQNLGLSGPRTKLDDVLIAGNARELVAGRR